MCVCVYNKLHFKYTQTLTLISPALENWPSRPQISATVLQRGRHSIIILITNKARCQEVGRDHLQHVQTLGLSLYSFAWVSFPWNHQFHWCMIGCNGVVREAGWKCSIFTGSQTPLAKCVKPPVLHATQYPGNISGYKVLFILYLFLEHLNNDLLQNTEETGMEAEG